MDSSVSSFSLDSSILCELFTTAMNYCQSAANYSVSNMKPINCVVERVTEAWAYMRALKV